MADKRLLIKLAADVDQLKAGMKQAKDSVSSFQSQVKSVGVDIASAFGITAGVTTFIGILKAGISQVAGFQHEMQAVRAITDASDGEFERLRASALNLGAAYKFTSTEVAELQKEFSKLGFTTQEIINSSKATILLATATGENLAKSAEIAGSTLRGFNLESKEMGRVTDVMAVGFNKSALGLDNFAEAIKYVAPVAAVSNVTIEETTALLGVLADAGIKGSMAGTALRRIFSELTNTGQPFAQRLDELTKKGLSLADAQDEVGAYAKTALIVLTNQSEKIRELTADAQNANGELKKMADIMADDLIGDWTKMNSAIDVFLQKGGGVTNVLRPMVQEFTDLVNLAGGDNFSFIEKIFAFTSGSYSNMANASKAIDELKAKASEAAEVERQRSIDTTVNAALQSGNVEAYIKALEQNVNKEEIIDAIRRRQSDELKKQLALMNEANAKRDKAAAIEAKISEIQRLKRIREVEKEHKGPAKTLADFTSGQTKDPLSLLKGHMAELEPVKLKVAEVTEEFKRLAHASLMAGDVLGDAFATIVKGGDAVGTLRNATAQIVSLFAKQALAAAIAKGAIKSPLAIVGAAAGIAAMSALLSSVGISAKGGGGGGSSSGGSSQPRAADSFRPQPVYIELRGELRANGQDMAYTLRKQDYYQKVRG